MAYMIIACVGMNIAYITLGCYGKDYVNNIANGGVMTAMTALHIAHELQVPN